MAKKEFMIRLVTWHDKNMGIAAEKCVDSATKHGVDRAYVEPKEFEVEDSFYYFNKSILDAERGAGYWLFKPYCIMASMVDMNDGDILIYSDAGVEFVNSVHHIIDRMDENVFLFTNTHPNHHWTKRETLDAMMPGWNHNMDANTPWPQVQASVIFFKVCQETRDFVKRWLLWCQMPGIIDDTKGEQLPYFQDHRHDQSVLSVLATQAG